MKPRHLPQLAFKNSIILIVVCTLIATLIVDTLLSKIYTFSVIDTSPGWRTMIFLVIGVISAASQYLVLEFIRRKSIDTRLNNQLHINLIQKVVTIAQSIITGLLILIFFQMITDTSYNNYSVMAAVTISYILAAALMTMLAKRFFTWFVTNRNLAIILYGVASTLIAANASITILYVDILLSQQPVLVPPHPSTVSPAQFLGSVSITGILNQGFIMSSLISFASFWVATIFLIKHHSRKIGKAKFWILVSIPLIYFVCQFSPYFLDLFTSIRQSQPIMFGLVYTVIFTLSKPVGGILFGIAFWIVARSLPIDSKVRKYLIISALGIVLLFTSNQAIILVSFSYPPFGIATTSFMGLGSYLVLIGIYSSAISIGQDSKLRYAIRKITLKEAQLIDSIGSAHMEDQLVKNVLRTVKLNQNSLERETGIDTSLSQQEVSEYLHEVLEEVKINKRREYGS